MKRALSMLFCALVAVGAVGVSVAAAEDPPPVAGNAATAPGAATAEQGAAKCAPALGFVAGIVTAIAPPRISIEVKRAGALGAALVGGELAVVVAQRTKFFKNGSPARPGAVKIGDRIAVRALECRGDELSADRVRAVIVVDYGPGAAGDAGVAREKTAEPEPTAATVTEIGEPVRQGVSGRGQGAAGRGQGATATTSAGDGARARPNPGQGGNQGAGRTARTADGDGAAAENNPAAGGVGRPGQRPAAQGAVARARAQDAARSAGQGAEQGSGQGATPRERAQGARQARQPRNGGGTAPVPAANG